MDFNLDISNLRSGGPFFFSLKRSWKSVVVLDFARTQEKKLKPDSRFKYFALKQECERVTIFQLEVYKSGNFSVYKRVRGWSSGKSLPVWNFVE